MQAAPRRPADESGFTLIELLISTIVLGLIVSGVTASIILFFRTADGTSSRLALSHDSQLLATYLIPDLDSLTGATPAGQPKLTAPNGQTFPCKIPGDLDPNDLSFGRQGFALQISFTDLSTQNVYVAEYSVDTSETVITRKLWRNDATLSGPPLSTTEVVHNLKAPDEACFRSPTSAAPWTMTIGTGRPGLPSPNDFTFSVTGGGRVTYASPPPPATPVLTSASQQDVNGDYITNVPSLNFTVTVTVPTPGDTVTLSYLLNNGPPQVLPPVTGTGGTYSIPFTATDGKYTFTATVTDATLHTSAPSGATIVTVDTVAPNVTILSPTPNGSASQANGLLGTAPGDSPTAKFAIHKGTGISGMKVGHILPPSYVSGTWSVTWNGLTQGKIYTIVVTQTDAAGNVGSFQQTFTQL
jgi:prepilin-type N-terminal cleavage/methylation domain-containing protein